MSSPNSKKCRILCLHGYTQSSHLFRAKTRALEKALQKAFPSSPKVGYLPLYPDGVEFIYITAPKRLEKADLPTWDSDIITSTDSDTNEVTHGEKSGNNVDRDAKGENDVYGWWTKTSSIDTTGKEKVEYTGLEDSFSFLAEVLNTQGPFDGVLGFSQGACCAIMLASLLEVGRKEEFKKDTKGIPFPLILESGDEVVHRPFKFAVSYSGFRPPPNKGYDAFYKGGLSTPTLHFIGSVDTVVEESKCLELVEACKIPLQGEKEIHKVVYHPGGHFVPSSQKQAVGALVAFMNEILRQDMNTKGSIGTSDIAQDRDEENVEDMDMPF